MKLEIIVLREVSQICICQKDKYMFFSLDLKAVKLVVDVGGWAEEGGMRGRNRGWRRGR